MKRCCPTKLHCTNRYKIMWYMYQPWKLVTLSILEILRHIPHHFTVKFTPFKLLLWWWWDIPGPESVMLFLEWYWKISSGGVGRAVVGITCFSGPALQHYSDITWVSWHLQQCWKFPQVRQSEADNFGGGPETLCWFFFKFILMNWDSSHEDLQLFWLSFKHWSTITGNLPVSSSERMMQTT